jgi:hypothetical protein
VGGTPIPSSSSGSLVKIRLQVLCLDFASETQSQILIENYTDDLEDEFSPEQAASDFNFIPCGRLGDVNASGSVTPGDAQSAFEIFLGIITPDFCQESTSDANCNEFATPGDAQDIFEHFLGIRILPECCAEYTVSTMLRYFEPIDKREVVLPRERKLYPIHTMGYPGETVRIPVIITNPEGLTSFSFEMNYPRELLEFIGLNRSHLTQNFEHIIGIQISEGLLRVEGMSEEPVRMRKIGSLVVLEFRVLEGPETSLPLIIFNCEGDLFHAEISEGNFHRLNLLSAEPRYLDLGRAVWMPDGTIRIPVRVSNPFGVKSFGLKLEYAADKLTFIRVEKRKLTRDFHVVNGNEREFGKVMIGGYSLSGIQEKREDSLAELVFSVEEEGGEVKVVTTFDDIQNFIIRKGKTKVE